MSGKRKHVNVTLDMKLEALRRLANGEPTAKIASEYGVGKSTICDWKKKKANIESWCNKNVECSELLKNRSVVRDSPYKEVDKALFIWFCQERNKGVKPSGPILQKKALELNEIMKGDENFTASNGWLDRWKKRHGVKISSVKHCPIQSEEKSLTSGDSVDVFKENFRKLIEFENLINDQIYSCGKSILYYKSVPSKILSTKSDSLVSFKMQKEKVVILACSNANGSNKLPLMVIGKSNRPMAFKYSNISKFPIFYKYLRNACMDSKSFSEWFYDLFVPYVKHDLEKKKLSKKAVLLVDNSISPPNKDLSSEGITCIFFPFQSDLLIQPMDEDFFEILKQQYRKYLLSFLLEEVHIDVSDKLITLNIEDAIYWIASAWETVSSETIHHIWKKFLPDEDYSENEEKEIETEMMMDMLIKLKGGIEITDNDVEWLNGTDIITDDESINDLHKEVKFIKKEINENDEIAKHAKAAAAFKIALQYVEEHHESTITDIMLMKRWQNIAESSRLSCLQQTDVASFLSVTIKTESEFD